MPNTDRFSLLERWANGAEAFRDAMETKYGPAPTPPQLPPYTTYEAMLEAIVDNTVGAKRLLNKKSPTYHSDSAGYTKVVPAGDVHYASLESVGGKTLVWNQLVQNGNFADTSNWSTDNCTIAVNNNVLTATATSNTTPNFRQTLADSVLGHKYIAYVDIKPSETMSASVLQLDYTQANRTENIPSNVWTTLSGIITATVTTGFLRVYFNYNGVNNGKTTEFRNCRAFDLTLMYGAGNEPTTVAEFTAQFPAQYYPYNAGTLLSAGVTEVVSKGKNLLDTQRTVEVLLGYTSNTTKRNLAENQVWKGMGYSGYTSFNVTSYSLNNGSITYKSTTNGYGMGFPIKVKPSTTYRFHCTKGNTSGMFFLQYNAEGYLASNVYNNFGYDSVGVTTTATTSWLMVGFSAYNGSINTDITINDIMVEESSTDSAYTPYQENTYPILTEIRSLEGYGWSAGSVYNYIDFERKVFVKNVASVDLGTLSWTKYPSTYRIFTNGISTLVKSAEATNVANLICSAFTTTYLNDIMNNHATGIAVGSTGSVSVGIGSNDDTALDNLIASLNGVYLYYELATPIEVDISAYLTDDNLISVESGGTLIFPNSNGDDYRIPVPSSVTFVVGEP